jgi:hypothetical protein
VRLRPSLLLAIGATLDVVVALGLFALDIPLMSAFMGIVAVVGYGLAFVLWRRGT